MSIITAICVAPEHAAPLREAPSALIQESIGLVGDRYAGSSPITVSFVAIEEIEAFNERTGLSIAPAHTGRNLITRGVDLNRLVGKRFRVQSVEFEGMELCEPCATLGSRLATGEVTASRIVREFTHRAGLRAYVRSSGEIRVGDPLDAPGYS